MTQCEIVIQHLEKYGSITPLDAIYDYGITRLSGVVYKLKRKGYVITTTIEEKANRRGEVRPYARYALGGVSNVEKTRS